MKDARGVTSGEVIELLASRESSHSSKGPTRIRLATGAGPSRSSESIVDEKLDLLQRRPEPLTRAYAELHQTHRKIYLLEQELHRARLDVQFRDQTTQAQGSRIRQLESQLRVAYSSFSWMVTRPIRLLQRVWKAVEPTPVGALLRGLYWVLTLQIVGRLRRRTQARVILQSGLFDIDFYLRSYPEVQIAKQNPLSHYLKWGAKSGYNPNPLFDTSYYLARVSGVGSQNPLYHYITCGAAAGEPTHLLFDTRFYYQKYMADTARIENPLAHFLHKGAFGGCNPHPLFDVNFYFSQNESVRTLKINPVQHYLEHGVYEGKDPHPLFDTSYYLSKYADIAALRVNPLLHFVSTGGVEGRRPHPLFQGEFYLKCHADLVRSRINPLVHYLAEGENKNNNPSPFFDVAFYRKRYLTPQGLEGSPLVHFSTYGWAAGNNPSERVNFAYYLRHHPFSDGGNTILRTFFEQIVEQAGHAYLSPTLLYDQTLAFESSIGCNTGLREAPLSTEATAELGLRFFGYLPVVSGLGEAARGYYNALIGEGIQSEPIAVEVPNYQEKVALPAYQGRCDWPLALAQVNADTVQMFFKNQAREFLKSRYRVGLWVWELPSLQPEWSVNAEPFNEIWVPSTYVQRAVQAITSRPVYKIPYVVELPPGFVASKESKQRLFSKLNLDQAAYSFLYVFDASSYVERKNPFTLVRAFLAEFAGVPGVSLVLKVSYSKQNKDFDHQLQALLRADTCKQVRVIDTVLSRTELYELVAHCDCYVSPHRAEGFGLTLAEALLCARPVIATNFSSTTDFITDATAFPVDYDLEEIAQSIGPYLQGAVWAAPREAALAERMREVFNHREMAAERGQQGRNFVLQRFSRSAVGQLMRERVEHIYRQLRGGV